MSRLTDIAARFARSLDQEDYARTAACLASNCEYHIAGITHFGPAAIIAAYRDNGDWAARELDSVRYRSTVRETQPGGVVVEFVDHLEHAGISHVHRCEQRLEFDQAGLIARITHIELPGEKKAVERFFRSVGVTRPTAAEHGS